MKDRLWYVSIDKHAIEITKNVNNHFHKTRFENPTRTSRRRARQLQVYARTFQRRPYLVFGV